MSHTPKIPGINVFDSLSMGGDVKMVGLPTSDPEVEDKLWNDNGGIKVSAGSPVFNITTRDTETNILASTPTNPSGEATVAYGTDTGDFYIYDGSAWYIYSDDSIIIEIDTESSILSSSPTNPTNYATIKHASDTNDLYVYHNESWFVWNND